MRQFLNQQGFLTIAQNTDVDYLGLAYVQAMSIKSVMPNSKYAIIVDEETNALVTSNHRKIFDYIIPLPIDLAKNDEWKLANECQIFDLTPFKETIKLEADLLLPVSIEHWWPLFRLRDIVLSMGCRDYKGNQSAIRDYRKIFDDNELPDVYNGLMYFRFSRPASDFFALAKMIWREWESVTGQLKNYRDELPSTDLVYAITAKILGVENCTLPSGDFINFTHMKSAINNWPNIPWQDLVVSELDLPMIRINNVNQYQPLHYHEKSWISDKITKEYEAWLKI